MDGLRTRLESHLVRRATELVRELSDERTEHLGELLAELEERGTEVSSAETRLERIGHRAPALGAAGDGAAQVERLVVQLERRDQELADLRAAAENERRRTDELRAHIARLEAEAIALERRSSTLAERERAIAAMEARLEERIRTLKRRSP
jgi:chromosome segregation ATPase